MKKYRLITTLLVVIVGLFAGSVASADAPVEGREGRAEVRFLEGMIDHHQMALDMAYHCLEHANSETLRTICQNVIDAQAAEIAMMQDWLFEWYNVHYAPVAMNTMNEGDMSGMDHSAMGHGVTSDMPQTDPPMTMGMMAGLNRLEGIDYEIAWLESMIDHHDDAIHMSERLLNRVSEEIGHAELLGLAQQIIDDQTAEIESMELLIIELSGE